MLIGICGHYSDKEIALNGQTVKTKILTEVLEEVYGKEEVAYCDTHNWKRKLFRFGFSCMKLLFCCKNIILLPAQSAVLTLFPMFVILNHLFHRKIHYYVVGGWLLDTIEQHPKLLKYLKAIDGIYVELHTMEAQLKKCGLTNVYFVNKFRKLQIISETEIPVSSSLPLRFCIFSRIMKEKGVEEAITSITTVNKSFNSIVCTLDIYGQVDPNYQERFEKICKKLPSGVLYKGFVDFASSGEVLKQYDALLFPTYYEGEGYANTIVDAYASGLPVIATDWKYNKEVICDGNDGKIYDYRHPDQLTKIINYFVVKPEELLRMRNNARQRAFEYNPKTAVSSLLNNIKSE